MRARGSMLTVLVLVLLGVFATSGIAFAHDHVVPEPTLHAAGQSQDAGFVEIQWIWRTGPNSCVQLNAIGTGQFPDPPIAAPAGTKTAYIDLDKADAPAHIELHSWAKRDRGGSPAGRTTDYEVTLSQRKDTLRAYFTPQKRGTAYLQLFAVWPDEEGCGGDQWGIWRFSLSVASP
jgi:hypothetical protein